jgi:hypothetical protein
MSGNLRPGRCEMSTPFVRLRAVRTRPVQCRGNSDGCDGLTLKLTGLVGFGRALPQGQRRDAACGVGSDATGGAAATAALDAPFCRARCCPRIRIRDLQRSGGRSAVDGCRLVVPGSSDHGVRARGEFNERERGLARCGRLAIDSRARASDRSGPRGLGLERHDARSSPIRAPWRRAAGPADRGRGGTTDPGGAGEGPDRATGSDAHDHRAYEHHQDREHLGRDSERGSRRGDWWLDDGGRQLVRAGLLRKSNRVRAHVLPNDRRRRAQESSLRDTHHVPERRQGRHRACHRSRPVCRRPHLGPVRGPVCRPRPLLYRLDPVALPVRLAASL